MVINYQAAESVMEMFESCYLTFKFWDFNNGQFLGAEALQFSWRDLGICDMGICDLAELTSPASLSSAIILLILALNSPWVSANDSVSSSCSCILNIIIIQLYSTASFNEEAVF